MELIEVVPRKLFVKRNSSSSFTCRYLWMKTTSVISTIDKSLGTSLLGSPWRGPLRGWLTVNYCIFLFLILTRIWLTIRCLYVKFFLSLPLIFARTFLHFWWVFYQLFTVSLSLCVCSKHRRKLLLNKLFEVVICQINVKLWKIQ